MEKTAIALQFMHGDIAPPKPFLGRNSMAWDQTRAHEAFDRQQPRDRILRSVRMASTCAVAFGPVHVTSQGRSCVLSCPPLAFTIPRK